MKTPREILLDRHREAQPSLDMIRNEICAGMRDRVPSEVGNSASARDGFLAIAWQELFVCCKRYWVGLGVSWCVIVLVIVMGQSGRDGVQLATAERPDPVLQAMREQLQLRAELLGSTSRRETPPVRRKEELDRRSRILCDHTFV